jgi:uncharacterized protein YegP (UPF0339 family)
MASVPYYAIYKDAKGEYRWRYRSANNETIADSAEGYKNESDCRKGIEIMKASKDSVVITST